MPALSSQPLLESIWDYPLTPAVESVSARVQVIFNGFLVADSDRPLRLVRRGFAPQYYFPKQDVRIEYLTATGYREDDPSLGAASFYSIEVGDRTAKNAVWCFHAPAAEYAPLADRYAFDPAKVDAAFVEGEPVLRTREADAGWATRNIIGLSEGYPKHWRFEER